MDEITLIEGGRVYKRENINRVYIREGDSRKLVLITQHAGVVGWPSVIGFPTKQQCDDAYNKVMKFLKG